MQLIYREFYNQLFVESLGIFWIAAEVAILFSVSVLRRFLLQNSIPNQLRLTAKERRRLLFWAILVALLAASTLGRHLVVTPFPTLLVNLDNTLGETFSREVSSIYTRALLTHLAIWSFFITLWIVLEILIVYKGFRVFQHIRVLRRAGNG